MRWPYANIGVVTTRTFRNLLNKIHGDIAADMQEMKTNLDNAVETVSEKAFSKVVDAAKIDWLPPVNTFDDLATTYPDAIEGKTAMCRDSGKVYRLMANGEWQEIQDIDPTVINEVDNRLTSQLAETTKNLGDKTTLETTEKSSAISAINSIKRHDYEKFIPGMIGFKGICIRSYRAGDLYTDRYRIYAIEKARRMNCDSVCLVINIYQSSFTSNNPREIEPVTVSEIRDYIVFLKQQGLKVMFKPHVEKVDPYEWRESIDPSDPNTWFSIYTDLMVEYANMCEELGVESLCIGSEYRKLTTKYIDKWVSLAETVRPIFSGIITYGANYNSAFFDEGYTTTLWGCNAIDAIGLDYWIYPTTNYSASVEEIEEAMRFDHQNYNDVLSLDKLYERYKKPILFTEYGVSNDQTSVSYQSNFVQALFKQFSGKSFLNGMFVWVIDPIDGSTDEFLKDFSDVENTVKNFYKQKIVGGIDTNKIFHTRVNSSASSAWVKIAKISSQRQFSTTSLKLYLEEQLPNTQTTKYGNYFVKVGRDSSEYLYNESKLTVDSTLMTSEIGYLKNENSLEIFLLVRPGSSFLIKELSNNANMVEIYDSSPFETINPQNLINPVQASYASISSFELENGQPSFPNGTKILSGSINGNMTNGLFQTTITIPYPVGYIMFYSANCSYVGGGNTGDVISNATVGTSSGKNRTLTLQAKHISGSGSYSITLQWIFIGN